MSYVCSLQSLDLPKPVFAGGDQADLNTLVLAAQGRRDPAGQYDRFADFVLQAQRQRLDSPFSECLVEFVEMSEDGHAVRFALEMAIWLALDSGPTRDLIESALRFEFPDVQLDRAGAEELLSVYIDCEMLAGELLYCPVG